MPSRPLIAVTTSEVRQITKEAALANADPPRREMVLGLTYTSALQEAGGAPVIVPPLDSATIGAVLDAADGVCLTGGPDIHPSRYGADPHPRLGPTDVAVDEDELALARAADARRMPILAICRGAQLMNVARGGTLAQHLPDRTELVHRQTAAGGERTHAVAVQAGSRLGETLGTDHLMVNSFHHQAVDVLGAGLQPSAWAPDGTVEGYEAPDRPFLLAVQWHAELLTDLEPDRRLFAAFVAACERDGAAASEPEVAR